MKYKMVSTKTTPSGGWVYTQPESGACFKHYDFTAWRDSIYRHRKANGYLIPVDFEARLINDACEQNPHWDECLLGDPTPTNRVRETFREALRYLNVLGDFLKSGGKYVEQEEAERRASICVRCPNNVEIGFSCGACAAAVLAIVEWVLGKRTTSYDDRLKSCKVCTCRLTVAVHYPVEAQKAGLSEEMKQEFSTIDYCWKK